MFDYDLLDYLEGYLTDNRKDRFQRTLSNRTKFLTIAIEDVFQLHNTSAIIRSCDAFGIQEVHVVEDRFEDRLDKNIAMGAQQWVDVSRYRSTPECLERLRNKGYSIVATVPDRKASALPDFSIEQKTALFFGTERDGLSNDILQQADDYLTIPMVGFSESLNVSVSAAIVIQNLADKLRNSHLPWRLSEIEILDKRLDWTKKSIKNVEQIIERYLGN